LPTLIIDGDARGAVRATSDVAKGYDQIAASAAKAGNVSSEAQRKTVDSLLQQRRAYDQQIASVRRLAAEIQKTTAKQSVMGDFLMRWAGPSMLFTGAIAGLRQYVREIDTLVDKVKSQSGGMAALAQLSVKASDPAAAYKKSVDEVMAAIGAGAVPSGDLNQGANLILALKGASLARADRDYLVGLQATQSVEDVTKLAPAIAAFQSSYPELTAKDIVGKGLATADVGSSRLDELVKEMASSATGARKLGWSPDWVLSAGGVLDRTKASAAEGSTLLSSFQRQFERYGLKNYPELSGKGPLEVLDFMSAKVGDARRRGLSVRDVEESFVGNRAESLDALGLLTLPQNRAAVARQMDAARRAEELGYADTLAGLPSTVPFMASGQAGRIAEGQTLAATLPATSVPAALQAALESQIAQRREERPGFVTEFQNFITRISQSIAPLLPDSVARASVEAHLSPGVISDPALRAQLESALGEKLDQQTQVMQSIDSKTKSAPLRGGRQE
jgi:hypothetical protein